MLEDTKGLAASLKRPPPQAWKALAASSDYCTCVGHAGLGH